MSHAELLANLLPLVSYNPNGPALVAELTAEGAALDSALTHSSKIQAGITPFDAGELLRNWERVCGLTATPQASYRQRVEAVLLKLAETGGLSIPYFVRLAKQAGYKDIQIREPGPFRAGENRAGDCVGHPDLMFVWEVLIRGPAWRRWKFRAGGRAGERLFDIEKPVFNDPVIVAIFQELKPAHTHVRFQFVE